MTTKSPLTPEERLKGHALYLRALADTLSGRMLAGSHPEIAVDVLKVADDIDTLLSASPAERPIDVRSYTRPLSEGGAGWKPIEEWPKGKREAVVFDPKWGVTLAFRHDSQWTVATFNGQVIEGHPTHFYAPGLPAAPSQEEAALGEGEIARGRGASGPSKRVPWEPTAEMLEAGNSQIEEPISPTGPDGEEADWLSPAQGIWWRMMEAAPDLAPPSRGGTATVQESLTAPHHPEAGGAPDLSRIAKSLADMLTEYVQGGIDSNQNWRNGLNEIIARRLQRLLPTGGAPGREEITVAIFKRAFHLEDVATSELIQKRKQDFAPVWEHAEECADAILALFPNTRPVSGSSEDGR